MSILTISNKKEEAKLRQKTVPLIFKDHTRKEIQELINKMRKIMIEANGIGLAANQIGLNLQMFVARAPDNDGKMKFYSIFNPIITKTSKETLILTEGCLSVPGLIGDVERAPKIMLSGFDKLGKPIKIKAWGLLAHIFQHEVDHLNGIVFIDKAKKTYDALMNKDIETK